MNHRTVAMGEMLSRLERRGYAFTTLGQALQDDAYRALTAGDD